MWFSFIIYLFNQSFAFYFHLAWVCVSLISLTLSSFLSLSFFSLSLIRLHSLSLSLSFPLSVCLFSLSLIHTNTHFASHSFFPSFCASLSPPNTSSLLLKMLPLLSVINFLLDLSYPWFTCKINFEKCINVIRYWDIQSCGPCQDHNDVSFTN